MKVIEILFNKINKKNVQYGINSVLSILMVAFILVLINIIFDQGDEKGLIKTRFDLTPNHLFSLTGQTETILEKLNQNVQIYAFFDEAKMSRDAGYKEVVELLRLYKNYRYIKIDYIDLDNTPGLIKQIDPDNLKRIERNDLIVQSAAKSRKLSYYDLFTSEVSTRNLSTNRIASKVEQALTGAIRYVTAEKSAAIYFLTGHEERNFADEYNTVRRYLERNNYEVKTLNLTGYDRVPEDTEILIITAPKKDMTGTEKNKIMDYLADGGNAMVLFDVDEYNQTLSNFDTVLHRYNLSLNNDRVKENTAEHHVINRPYDIIPIVENNKINQILDPKNYLMIIPNSRSIQLLKNTKDHLIMTPLLVTSASATGEFLNPNSPKPNQGPLVLAAAVEDTGGPNPAKLIVIGNGSFITDTIISRYEQYSLNALIFFLNALNWMQNKKTDILIEAKQYDTPNLTMNARQTLFAALILVIMIPLLIFAAGIFVWLRRRHL